MTDDNYAHWMDDSAVDPLDSFVNGWTVRSLCGDEFVPVTLSESRVSGLPHTYPGETEPRLLCPICVAVRAALEAVGYR